MTVTLVNTGIPRLVGLLSHKRLLSLSFEETARVESLCKGLSSEQSSGFLVVLCASPLAEGVGFFRP